VARVYEQHLASDLWRPNVAPEADHSYHLFVVATAARRRLIEHLDAAGIGYGIHYPVPIHRQPAYAFLNCRAGDLPVTERMADCILSLPCYPELSHDAVRAVCQVVNDVAAKLE
jgi:dTDP-4-amino-4,6-dideoxygalactose transaminase